jgi:hypothetical protein
MTRSAVLTIVLFALLAAPAAGAKGPYAGADAGAAGVTVPGLGSRYVAHRAGGGTVVTQVDRDGGRIRASQVLPGRLVVPAVAADGSATGLSADVKTLVLAAPRRFPSKRSLFTVLDTERLMPRTTITLPGDFTLDAISPDGNLLYLIESTSPDDLTRYAVRAYDVAEGRLLADAIVDPEEADEPMRGSPLARVMSRDGRWAYTLYEGEHPFIHALDTVGASAKCIDLDELSGRDDLWSLRLKVERDGTVAVRQPGVPKPLLVVDPRSFAVREPGSARPRAAEDERGGASTPWLVIIAGLSFVGLVGIVRTAVVRSARAQAAR